MEKTSILLNNIHSQGRTYLNLKMKATRLEIYERVTNLISVGISMAFITILTCLAFMFLNIALAFWLSVELGSFAAGFGCVGGFYTLLLGVYVAFRKKIVNNTIKNRVLLTVSKDIESYETLIREQVTVQGQLSVAETHLRENFDQLKENIATLKDDLNRLKNNFVTHKDPETHQNVGPKIPRAAITTVVDLLLNKVLLKNSGMLAKTILPIITNAVVTSKVFKEAGKTSLIENLKLKLARFL